MSLTKQEVEHIAELARLQLSEKEISLYQDQLSEILDYASRLLALDTSGIPPTASVMAGHNVMRVDEARPGLSPNELMRNAPDVEKGQFRVPPVLE